MIDALVDFIYPEDSPGNLAINAAHDINSTIKAIYTNFGQNVLCVA